MLGYLVEVNGTLQVVDISVAKKESSITHDSFRVSASIVFDDQKFEYSSLNAIPLGQHYYKNMHIVEAVQKLIRGLMLEHKDTPQCSYFDNAHNNEILNALPNLGA